VPSAKVRWLDWSDEAFQKARAADTPVVLHLTASWSNGCRVMEDSTYADDEVAGLLNRDYVAIRVDIDRRPDLNDRYNLGGIPTTAFLTPGGDLIGGTTYVERNQMIQLLVQLKIGYARERHRLAEEIARRDAKIAEALERPPAGVAKIDMEIFRKTVRGIVGTFDPLHGGFGEAPKYPLVGSLRVVLQALHETQGPDFQQVFLKTLDAIGDRGLFDPVEGGWYHYSTNDLWTLPRFEKLTEDNAGLIKLYLDASIVTGRTKYLERAAAAVGWARSTLLDPERGVFGGSQFADEEYFTARPEVRSQRPRPPVDRTVYTNQSSAMASAFLRAAQVMGEPGLSEIALRGLDWLFRECVGQEGVAHLHDGQSRLPVLLRDPAALASAAIDAYDHTGEERWLTRAVSLAEDLPRRFWAEAHRALADRAVDQLEQGELGKLRVNLHENASAAETFARLYRIGGKDEHRQWAEKLLLAFPDFYDGYGHQTAEYAIAADWIVRPPEKTEPSDLKPYLPRRVVHR
jgi:uncharacterized protein YyaL (SSP411 family)